MATVGKVESAGDGWFLVNGEKVDLGALQMMLQIDRTKELDRGIADQMQQIQDRNKQLKALNELMSQMRKHKAEGKDDDASWSGSNPNKDKVGDTFKIAGMDDTARSIDQWLDHLGYGSQKTDVQYNKSAKTRDAQWDANIELIKGKIDGLNSDSQLDMIRLQSLIDKRNQAFEMASNTLQKDQKTRDSIAGNFR